MSKAVTEPEITILHEVNGNPILMRYSDNAVAAGFPSPAADYLEEEIDFNDYLKPRPNATFVIRVKGDSMIEAHIPDNCLLIVDKSLKPSNNSIIIAVVDNEFTVKRLIKNSSGVRLMPANIKYKPIPITEDISRNSYYTEVYTTNKKQIGNIPNFIAGGILHYDTGEQTLGTLQWVTVYLENQSEINNQIKRILAMEDVSITAISFHKLLVRNLKEEIVGEFKAVFENEKWNVYMIAS